MASEGWTTNEVGDKAGAFKLVIVDDEDGKTTVVPLVRSEILVGRAEGNTIRLPQRNVSRRHAKLSRTDTAFVIEDLGSMSGIRLNGEPIETPVPLSPGDEIGIGDYHITFQAAPSPTTEVEGARRDVVTPPRLVMVRGPSPGAEFALGDARMTLGRAEELDIWINHRSISREHAVLECNDGRFVIIDRESANGIRVNGRDAKRAELRPGDLIELGQVVLEFLPLGSATNLAGAEARAERLEKRTRSVWPWWLLLLATTGAGIFLVLQFRPQRIAQDVSVPSHLPPLAPVRTAPGEIEGLRLACAQAVVDNNFARAREFVRQIRLIEAADDAATRCETQARIEEHAFSSMQRAEAALQSGDYDGAAGNLSQIDPSSRLRREPEMQSLLVDLLDRVAGISADRPGDQRRVAGVVSGFTEWPEVSGRARDVLAAAPEGEDLVASHNAPPRSPPEAQPPSAAETASLAPSEAASIEPATSPMDNASACVLRGDHRCVVRELSGRARSEEEMILLIETYRHLGDIPSAERGMRRYLSRYPEGRRGGAYTRALGESAATEPTAGPIP